MRRRIALCVLWAAVALFVASVVQSYAAGSAFRLVNPKPAVTTTTGRR